MAEPQIWTELLTYGLGVARPTHIVLLLLLLLGGSPLRRGGALVVGSLSFRLGTYLGWQGVSGLMVS